MSKIAIAVVILALIGSSLACCRLPSIPDIDITVPTIEIGPLQETEESVPLGDAESASVKVLFGAGGLDIEAGSRGDLFAGTFRYNVEQWAPEVSYENGQLTVQQGDDEQDWGIPTGDVLNVRNEWGLAFSPEIPLDMVVKVGAGDSELDLTGLQIEALDLQMGAGNVVVRFDEPNEIELERFNLDTGAAKLDVMGIGNAGPDRMTVNCGVGDIGLDFAGAWSRSTRVKVVIGVGSVTLRLPDDVGVRVDVEGGLSNVSASGLRRSGDAYVNGALGESDIELRVEIKTGVGQVSLIEVTGD